MKYILFQLTWCSIVVAVINCEQRCCKGSVYDKNSDLRCCGNTTYHINTMDSVLCCNGNLIKLINSSNGVGCCGTNGTYNYHTERCCSGVKLEKPNSNTEYQCCGRELYNPLNFTCCGKSQLKLVNVTGDMACCGQSTYNATQYKCCESRQVQSAGHSAVVVDYVLYLRNQSGPGFECCGSKLVDFTKYKCCGNEIFNLSANVDQNFQCCYGPFKNTQEIDQVCEGQHVYKNVTVRDCCAKSHVGTNYFDSDTQECCGDVLMSKWTDKGNSCCAVVDCYKL